MPKVHIGKKIKEVLDNSPIKAVDLAKKINLTRNGLYKIFEKEAIATDQLQKISEVLKHDFFIYYQNILNIAKEDVPKYGYAAKEDLETLTRIVTTLAKEIEKMRVDVSKIGKQKSPKKIRK